MNPEILLLIILFIASFALLLTNFDLSVFVMLVLSVLLHKELFSIFKWDVLPIRLFMLAFLCYGVLAFFKTNKTFKEKLTFFKDPFVLILTLIWVVSGFSIYFSKNLYSSLSLYGFFTCIVASVLALYRYFRGDIERPLKVLRFYMYLAAVLCLFCVFQAAYYLKTGHIIGALWNIPGNIPRLGATFWDVNHFGALLAALIPPLGAFFLATKKRKRLIYLAMLILMTGILFLTNSRSAWIIAGVSSLSFISLLLFRKVGKKGLVGLGVVILILFAGFFWEYSDRTSPFRKFIKDQFHYRIDSFDSHIMLLKGSYQIFEKYPFLGGGYGGFFEHFSQTDIAAEYFGRDPAALNTRVPAHTIWGEALSETGIVGFVLLVSFVVLLLVVPLYTALRSNDRIKVLLSSAIFSALLGWFIAGIFYSYKSEFFWIIITLYFSISVGLLEKGVTVRSILARLTKSRLSFLVIALTAFILVFSGLGRNHLIPWDEAIYAKIAKNMTDSGEYVSQYWKPVE
ncbi:MAG: O-antigen ligase family protein, partial [Patescibacteria group bacterium]